MFLFRRIKTAVMPQNKMSIPPLAPYSDGRRDASQKSTATQPNFLPRLTAAQAPPLPTGTRQNAFSIQAMLLPQRPEATVCFRHRAVLHAQNDGSAETCTPATGKTLRFFRHTPENLCIRPDLFPFYSCKTNLFRRERRHTGRRYTCRSVMLIPSPHATNI